MEYRSLTLIEISELKLNNCKSRDWNLIQVHPQFTTTNIKNVTFSGFIQLGLFSGEFFLPGGFIQESGLENVSLHNCKIGSHTYVGFVHNYIANYTIGSNTYIKNIQCLFVEGESTFGNGTNVSVMNEFGGREVIIYDQLSAHLAYIYTFYRHRSELIARIKSIISTYVTSLKSSQGTIGVGCKIINAGSIKNVRIGDYTVIEGTRLLENGSINSNHESPVHVGYSVIANDFIISSGTRITDGVMLKRCFIGQACKLGHTYSATDSLFFSNCQGENGEAASIFAGPYTVTHHKSTLLIAGMFSFMNAGSGSNQSNHMYKLGAIHQGIVERGGKTTSNSYILWPARIGAFSLIMGRHTNNSDTSNLPFSYLIENNDQTLLMPGVNLRSVGTIRDAQKFPRRDNRKDFNYLDYLNFNLLSPYTIQKMFKGVEILNQLKLTSGETSSTYSYQGCIIKSSSLNKGLKFYDLAIVKFLGNSIISRLSKCNFQSLVDIKKCLLPDAEIGLGDWRDLAGLIVPKTEVSHLMRNIESGVVATTFEIQSLFKKMHDNYYSYEWSWALDKIEKYFKVSIEDVTIDDLISIIQRWKQAVIQLDNLIYEDAKKEFSLSSRISFGLDGNRYTQQIDFEEVRGVFEENDFVKTIMQHIATKEKLGNDMIAKLSSI